jgi:DNA-binding XRE family transcriptional regulator
MRIFNEITNYQNDENENEYLKSMYPKQKSYIPRFSLIIHVFDEFFSEGGNSLLISKESILKAEKLSKYFIATAKKVKVNSIEVSNIKTSSKNGKNINEKLKLIHEENPNFNRSQTAELLGVSRVTINKWLKELENCKPSVK